MADMIVSFVAVADVGRFCFQAVNKNFNENVFTWSLAA